MLDAGGCFRVLVRPSTILDWFRELAAQNYYCSAQRTRPGRARKADELCNLVIRLAGENLAWGYTKIYPTVFNDVQFGCSPWDG